MGLQSRTHAGAYHSFLATAEQTPISVLWLEKFSGVNVSMTKLVKFMTKRLLVQAF